MLQTLRWALALAFVLGILAGCAPKDTAPVEGDATPPVVPSSEDAAEPSNSGETDQTAPSSGPVLGAPAEQDPSGEPESSESVPNGAEDDAEAGADAPAEERHQVADNRPAPRAEPAAVAGVALISRETFFGNPDKASTRLSPDGSKLSYLAPLDGVLNVFVGPVDDPDAARPVTDDKYRGIRTYFWAYDNRHVLYLQDKGGDEDWHVYSVDLESKETKDLTPIDKVNAQIEGVSEKFPEEILVGLNDRDARYHDIYRINIDTGERNLVQENRDFAGFITDDDYRVRFATKYAPDGGNQLYEPDAEGGWSEFEKIPFEDALTTRAVGFDKSGNIVFMTDSRGRDTAAMTEVDLETRQQKVLAENDQADVSGVLVHPTEKNIQAVSFNYKKLDWDVLDPDILEDFEYLKTVSPGEIGVGSRTQDDSKWIVSYVMDDGPVRYYLYDRPEKKAAFLFTNRQDLEGLPLAKMHPVVVESRDGMDLVDYLSLPVAADPQGAGRPKEPLPMVLLVHGGPWSRDSWGYNPLHQLLANRGYAVLSVNYRGSTGFGKNFTNAGNKQWAAKMHDDLIDSVQWAIRERIADPARVAIMGGSYGGYATLVGLTFTPEVFACGVDIVGPSNIETLLSTIPSYWVPAIELFKNRVGDHQTEEGRKMLAERSPLTYVDRIQRPLLIGQGANDPRVKQAESDQIVSAMQAKDIPVTYILFGDEGHGFARPENRLAFFAVAEAFLAEQLGGRYEPIGKAFAGSTISCPQGAGEVPGLPEALAAHAETKAAGGELPEAEPASGGR